MDTLVGYDGDWLPKPVEMSGASVYQPGPKCGEWDGIRAVAGVTGSQITDLAAAAAERAQTWASAAYTESDRRTPQLDVGAPEQLSVQGREAHLATVIVHAPEPPSCSGTITAVVYALALKGNSNDTLILMLIADQKVTDAVSDADLRHILTSVRPAGLIAEQCKKEGTVGSWC